MCGVSPPLSGTKVISTSYAVPDGFDEASFEAELDAEVLLRLAVEPSQIRRYLELGGWLGCMLTLKRASVPEVQCIGGRNEDGVLGRYRCTSLPAPKVYPEINESMLKYSETNS